MISDHAVIDGTELAELLAANAHDPDPADDPGPASTSVATLPILATWELYDDGDGKQKRRGLPMCDIVHEVNQMTGGWPRRVGKTLFVPGDNYEPRFLETPAQLLAYLDAQAVVDWGRGTDMVSQERFMAHLQETAARYETVERYPHWPPMNGAYYLHPPLPVTEGQYLEQFVDFFAPSTDVDRELIKAFTMSMAWGGPPGSRPAWLFTAREDDPERGRGVGKSTLPQLCAELVGGMMEISTGEDIVAIKKRLLSPEARSLRLCRLDNVKTYRFSWSDLEGLITSPIISGHQMFKGEGRRPNTIVWAITLNGASLSTDLAKRVIVVTLARPTRGGNWEKDVHDFIAERRWHILNDIRLALQA